jgi:hypothetical protein
MTFSVLKRSSPPKRRKPRRGREYDEIYLDHIRALRCAVTDAPPPSEPHHVRKLSGMATKPSDHQTVPLQWRVHRFLEDHGPIEFEKRYGFTRDNLLGISLKLYAEYEASRRAA